MEVGDLVRVANIISEPAFFGKTGIVLGRKRRYELGKAPWVRVFMEDRELLFEYCSLGVISESR